MAALSIFTEKLLEESSFDCDQFIASIESSLDQAVKLQRQISPLLEINSLQKSRPRLDKLRLLNSDVPVKLLQVYLQELELFFSSISENIPGFVATAKQLIEKQLAASGSFTQTAFYPEQLLEEITEPTTYIALSLQALSLDLPHEKEKLLALKLAIQNFSISGDQDNIQALINSFVNLFSAIESLQTQEKVLNLFSLFASLCSDEALKNDREKINGLFLKQLQKKLQASTNKKKSKKFFRLLETLPEIDSINAGVKWLQELDHLEQKLGKKELLFSLTPLSRSINSARIEVAAWLSGGIDAPFSYIRQENENSTDYQTKAIIQQLSALEKVFIEKEQTFSKRVSQLSFKFQKTINRNLWQLFDTEDQRLFESLEALRVKVQQLLKKVIADGIKNDTVTNDFNDLLIEAGALANSIRCLNLTSSRVRLLADINRSLRIVERSLPTHPIAQEVVNEGYRERIIANLGKYKQQRDKLPLTKGLLPNLRSMRLWLFDEFFNGGKKYKVKNGDQRPAVYDGSTHRLDAAEDLIRQAKDCRDLESYFILYVNMLREIHTIRDKGSKFRKILIDNALRILQDKLIPGGKTEHLLIAYQSFDLIIKNSSKRAKLQRLLKFKTCKDQNISDLAFKKLFMDKNAYFSYLEAIGAKNKKREIVQTACSAVDKDDLEVISYEPSLSLFHKTLLRELSSALLAYKVASAGILARKRSATNRYADNSVTGLFQLARVGGLPSYFPTQIVTYVFDEYADSKTRKVFANISELLESASRCDELAHTVALNAVKILEYQVQELAKGDIRNNPRRLAKCCVERIIAFLGNGVLDPEVPIEEQMCNAILTQRTNCTFAGTRLVSPEVAGTYSSKALIAEKVLERTPVLGANGQIYGNSRKDFTHGVARYSESLIKAQKLYPIESDQVSDNYRYKTSPPVFVQEGKQSKVQHLDLSSIHYGIQPVPEVKGEFVQVTIPQVVQVPVDLSTQLENLRQENQQLASELSKEREARLAFIDEQRAFQEQVYQMLRTQNRVSSSYCAAEVPSTIMFAPS